MNSNKGGNTVEKASGYAKTLADELGLILWDVVFEKEGAMWYLRIYLDKKEGLSMTDCEAFSRPYNKFLDEEDFIEQNYIFEAGSSGIDRKLVKPEHFVKSIGETVRVRLIRAVDEVKEIVGKLTAFNSEMKIVTITTEAGDRQVNLSETSFVKLYSDTI